MATYVIDIEANSLLGPALDYSELPYTLKDTFKVWCLVAKNLNTGAITVVDIHDNNPREICRQLFSDATAIVGHNIVGYDLPVLKLYGWLDYTIGYIGEKSTIFGREVEVYDTLILSKVDMPDRTGGHSLDAWGKRLGNHKISFHSFDAYTDEMLTYCKQDVNLCGDVFEHVISSLKSKSKAAKIPALAIKMETKLVDLTVRQETFGFSFDEELAKQHLAYLEEKMAELSERVSPVLPARQLTQVDLDKMTPPKVQFTKDGKASANMQKWVKRMVDAGVITEANIEGDFSEWKIVTKDAVITNFPHREPLVRTQPADIEDLQSVHLLLLERGWTPTEWNERNLCCKSGSKTVVSVDEQLKNVARYIANGIKCEYSDYRLKELGYSSWEAAEVALTRELSTGSKKKLVVPTSPKITVGTDKKICPSLQRISEGSGDTIAADVAKYLTYRHRKNSIAGGGYEEGDEEANTGYLSLLREDGRVPTSADTVGAASGRYKHRGICNIPRVSSLFGKELRSLFRCGDELLQLGFDFASVEARFQGHYCIPYTDGDILAEQLVAEKPNDIHTITAKKLGISRDHAKSLNYACLPMDTKVLTPGGWKMFDELAVGDAVLSFNADDDVIELDTITAKHFFTDKEVIRYTNGVMQFDSTGDHRWYVRHQHDPACYFPQRYEVEFLAVRAEELQHSHDLKVSAALRDGVVLPGGCELPAIQSASCSGLESVSLGVQDTFCLTTWNSTFIIQQDGYTGITGNCLYGASPAKLSKMLSVPLYRAEEIYAGFWDSNIALRELRDKLVTHWKGNGRKFIQGIDGRALMSRSEHSLLNLLFQSAAALFAKYSVVEICRQLEAKGSLGDPFKNKLTDEVVWLMIVYHDEVQFAFNPSLVEGKVKKFVDKGDAERYHESSVGSSDVSGNDGGYYVVEKFLLSEVIGDSIAVMEELLKLRVDLGFSWSVGKNWAECH